MDRSQHIHTPSLWDLESELFHARELPAPARQPNAHHRLPQRGFLCYCWADSLFAQRLQTHLTPCQNTYSIDLWDEARLPAGSLWQIELAKALDRASLAVLLVSPDFLASPFITSYHLPSLLRTARTDGTRIISIITRPCLFAESPLKDFQPVNPPPHKPLSALSRNARDQFWVDFVRTLPRSH